MGVEDMKKKIYYIDNYDSFFNNEETDINTRSIFYGGVDICKEDIVTWFNRNGVIVYEKFNPKLKVDAILLFDTSDIVRCWRRLKKLNLWNNVILYLEESGCVDWKCNSGFIKFLRYPYSAVMTYRDDLLKYSNVYKLHINIGNLDSINEPFISFDDKEMFTMISANKMFRGPNELYSERKRIVNFFEKNYSELFDLYGLYWGDKYKNWKGVVKSKNDTYCYYKYAFCFENSRELGYITEKIFDCFRAGIVPIYAGAPNISQYIPKTCYIDYYKYKNMYELIDDLKKTSEEDYNIYLKNIREYINERKMDDFLLRARVNEMSNCIMSVKNNKKSKWLNSIYMYIFFFIDRTKKLINKVKTMILKVLSNFL